jgi:hypothetical protein
MTLFWTQFGLYEILRVYLQDQELGLLSFNNKTFIAEFVFFFFCAICHSYSI